MQNRWAFLLNQIADSSFFNILNDALSSWKTHGKIVDFKLELFENQIILIEAITDVSGCGIDQMVQIVQTLVSENGLEILPASTIPYLVEHQVFSIDFKLIPNKISEKILDEYSIILDFPTWIKGGTLQNPLKNTWMSRYLVQNV